MFENQMARQTTRPARNADQTAAGELGRTGDRLDGVLPGSERRGGLMQSGGRSGLAMFDFQARLDQGGHSRRSAEMAELGRARTHRQRRLSRTRGVQGRQCFQFRARRIESFVGFQFLDADFGRSDAGHRARSLDGQPQGFGVRRVVRHANPPQNGMNAVAVAAGVGQSLEDDHPHALGGHDSVVLGVEDAVRLARGQHAGVCQGAETR